MRYSNLEDWLSWLEKSHHSEIELGLERVGRVAQSMSLSLAKSKVVSIAGTNGKGSCVASLNHLLSAQFRVGCFTSPHFIDYNERIVIDNFPVSDSMIIEAFDRIDRARGDTSLSYFEFGTLAAIDIFQRSNLDVVILEVGLGGRLDAVNIIDADIAVVTSIGLDHQDWLGSDLEKIGFEKAGIFRRGKPALSAGHRPPQSVKEFAKKIGAQFYAAGIEFDDIDDSDGETWTWRGLDSSHNSIEVQHLPSVQLPRESVSASIQVVQLLGLHDKVNYRSLASLALTGRSQSLLLSGKQIILDVAHNPAAAQYLANKISQEKSSGKNFALVAIMNDKDVTGIMEPLIDYFDKWYAIQLAAVPRAMEAELLASEIIRLGAQEVIVCDGAMHALSEILDLMTTQDRLYVFGSFFTVAEVIKLQQSGLFE